MAEIPVVTPQFVRDKKVLLRYDLDVITDGEIDDFRLRAGLPTLKLCLEYASSVVMIGHVGRPGGKEVPELSVAPIYGWLENQGFKKQLESDKLRLLENLRFERGESFDSAQDLREENMQFVKDLATFGDVFVNEAFASYRKAASTTVLPTLLPHVAGLHFAKEVERLTQIRENPKKPLVVIMGGAKVEEKVPIINFMAELANTVLVGGWLVPEIKREGLQFASNVKVGELTEEGNDMADQTLSEWKSVLSEAKMVFWNGPLGKYYGEGESKKGTREIAEALLELEADLVIGGGDTVRFLNMVGLLDRFISKGAFISTGGGAMSEFLVKGTLPTIEALK